MTFRSKVDTFFTVFILIAIIIIGAVALFPLFLGGGEELLAVIILVSTFLIVTSLILWSAFRIKYVFYQDYLFVKGGIFRSRIPYGEISKVSPTTDIFTGYRILSSRDALEVFYKSAYLGTVKVSPEDKEGFITELQKRCPNVRIDT